jgi:enamine deaminase RidA (YjgF/YER057c/UK114 family)
MTTAAFRLVTPVELPKPVGYSHFAEVRGGRIIYIAGQVPMDASGALVGANDFRAQARQVFTNIDIAVKAAGGTFADVIKLSYFCSERVPPTDTPVVREIRDEFVNTAAPPVSTFVFVSRLVRPEWLIEIEAVAVISGERA